MDCRNGFCTAEASRCLLRTLPCKPQVPCAAGVTTKASGGGAGSKRGNCRRSSRSNRPQCGSSAPTPFMDTEAIRQTIAELERARCKAMVQQDLQMLDQLVADDVVHVHASGRVEDKATLEAGVHRPFAAALPAQDERLAGQCRQVFGETRQ